MALLNISIISIIIVKSLTKITHVVAISIYPFDKNLISVKRNHCVKPTSHNIFCLMYIISSHYD